jgi:hypothetical protein
MMTETRPRRDPFDEPPPSDLESEQAIAHLVLLGDAMPEIARCADPDAFMRALPRAVVRAAIDAFRAGTYDAVTLRSDLRALPEVEAAGGIGPVMMLMDGPAPDATRIEVYAQRIDEAAARRRMAAVASTVARRAHAGESTVGELADDLRQNLDSILASPYRGEARKRETEWRLVPLADLLAEPPEAVAWLVADLLPSGGTSLLVARPKVGKSTLARHLAARVATGHDFLGRPTSRGPVVYCAVEEKRAAVADHFRRMGVPVDAPIFLHAGMPPAGEVGSLLRALIRDIGTTPALIVIDPLAPLLRVADVSDYAVVSAAMAAITTIARDTGAHIMLLHHSNKTDNGEEGSILGSTALFGAVDSALLMKRRNDVRTIRSVQRYGSDLEDTAIRLDPVSGHVALAGEVAAITLAGDVAALIERIGDATLTEPEIRDIAGMDHTRASAALRAAVERDLLDRDGKGRRGSPFTYSKKILNTRLVPYERGESEYSGEDFLADA